MRTLVHVITILFAAMTCAVGSTPSPAFSFKYGGKPITGSASLQVDEHLKVTVEAVEYPQFDATE